MYHFIFQTHLKLNITINKFGILNFPKFEFTYRFIITNFINVCFGKFKISILVRFI